MTDLSASSLETLSELYHAYLGWSSEKAAGETVLFAYHGDITQHRIDNLLKLTETAVLDSGAKRKVMKRVCSIFIESFQNISIHGAKDTKGRGSAFLVLLGNKDRFRLVTGNLVLMQDANLLAYRIDQLNALNSAELRKLYIETLCNHNYSYKGGAGLGLLTVAKKSSSPIVYKVAQLDNTYGFFVNEVTVNGEEA